VKLFQLTSVVILLALVACAPDRSALVGDADVVAVSFDVQSSCSAPFPVQFSGDVRFDEEDSYLWDFGDGQKSREKAPVHVYENEGVYEVSLTVGNSTKKKLVEIVNYGLHPSMAVRTPVVYPNSVLTIENTASHYDSAYWEYRIGTGDVGIFYSHDFSLRVISLAPIEVSSVLMCKSGERVRLTQTISVLPHTTNNFAIEYLRYLPGFQPRGYVEFRVNDEVVGSTHQKSNENAPLAWTMPGELYAGTNTLHVSSNNDKIELLLYIDDRLKETYTLDTKFVREYRPTWLGFPYDPFFDIFNVRLRYD